MSVRQAVGRGADPVATRARILKAATRIYHARGKDGLTVRAVSQRAGVTAPTIYWHFENMGALHRTIVDGAFQSLADALERISGTTAVARLTSACRIYRDFAVRNPHAYRTMFLSLDPEGALLRSTRDTVGRQAFARLSSLVSDVLAGGGDHAVRSTTLALWGLCHGLVMLHLADKIGLDRAAFEKLYDNAIASFCASTTRKAR